MNRKNLLMWAMAVLMVFTAVNGLAQEEKKGPKIVKKDKLIHFLDEKGSVVMEISLEPKDIVTEKYSKPYKRNRKLSKVYYKFAAINSTGKYVGLIESESGENIVLEPGEPTPEGYGEVGATSKFSLVDSSGKTLWKKDFPAGRYVPDGSNIKISDNGEKTIVFTSAGEGGDQPILYVYDNKGNEVLKIGDGGDYIAMNDFELSGNGKYLAVREDNIVKNTTSVLFYNLNTKAWWDSLEDYVVFNISNDGKANVGNRHFSGKENNIDLKKHVGD